MPTGRERIRSAIQCEAVDRIPWTPFVGFHGGALIGATADDYLKSDDMIFQGVSAAIERYKPDGIPIVFDLQNHECRRRGRVGLKRRRSRRLRCIY